MNKIYKTILCLTLILGNTYQLNFAQSGRSVTKSETASEVSQNAEIPKDNQPCDEEFREIEELRFVRLEEFIKRINHFGNCGYRVNQIVRSPLSSDLSLDQMQFSALVKKDAESRYEYAWFIATNPGEAQTLANKYAEKGFYFRESMSFVYGSCGDVAARQKEADKNSGVLGDIFGVKIGQMGSFFLFEKKAGGVKNNEYRILDARITGKTGELEANKKKMDDYIAKGFRPVDLWYTGDFNEHFVVMEKDETVKPQGEYIFLGAYYGMHKKLAELGKQGYKLMFAGLAFALLHRVDEKPLNVEYDSFDNYQAVKKKQRKWRGKNVSYSTTGTSGFFLQCDPFDGKIFVSLATQNSKNKETLFLLRNEFIDEYLKRKNLNPTKKNPLTEEQKKDMDREFMNKINRLVGEGYKLVNFSMPNAEVYVFEREIRL